MSNEDKSEKYILENEEEVARLQVQHQFWKYFLNDQLLMPGIQEDLAKKDKVEVLETGTADGTWMRDVAKLLPNATFVGADITVSFFPPDRRDSRISYEKQDITKPPPAEFRERFDLLHQRIVLAALGPKGDLKATLKGLVSTLKPGGWIQLQEADLGALPSSNGPAMKMFTDIMGGLHPGGPKYADQLQPILEELGIEHVQESNVAGDMGVACGDKELGMKQAQSSVSAARGLSGFMKGKGMFPDKDLETMPDRYFKEMETQGGSLPCRMVWGRKKAA